MQAPAADTALRAALCVHAQVMAGEFPDGNVVTMNMSRAAQHGAVQLSVQLEPGICYSRRLSLLCLPSCSQAPAAVAGPPCSVCPAGARHLL